MIKYYVEFEHTADEESYCLQSCWFDTPDQATEWYINSFDFVRTDDLFVSVKRGELNEEGDLVGDIEFVEDITAKHHLRPQGMTTYEKLDLEEAIGFVIDLSTPTQVLKELENVLHDPQDRNDLLETQTIPQIREFILEYYTTTYYDDDIIVKSPNCYQIVTEQLYTKTVK